MIKRIPWFEIILTIAVLSISLYAALSDPQNFSWRWFTRDDAYYYFKVAQNISEGKGSTFDGINPTNGYHPLWTLVCVPIFALARFDPVLPLRILLMVLAGLSAGTGILLYRLIGRVFAPAIGALAASYWVFSYDLLLRVYQQGLETGIAAFFVALLAYKLLEFEQSSRTGVVTMRQLVALGAIAALAVFSRLDLVFLAGIVGIWIVFRGHLLRSFLPLDIVATFVSVLLSFILRLSLDSYYSYSSAAATMIGLSLVVNIPCAYLLGLYQRAIVHRPLKLLWRLVLFAVIGSAIPGAITIALTGMGVFDGFPRVTVFTNALFLFLFFGGFRLLYLSLQTERERSDPDLPPLPDLRAHWRKWLNDGIAYFGVVFGALGIYMVWNRIAYGTFSPVSGQIKRWWGSLDGMVYGGSARTDLTFFGIDYYGDGNAWHPVSTWFGNWAETTIYKMGIVDTWRYLIILTAFAIAFYLTLLINRRRAKSALAELSVVPLLSGAFLQVFYYHTTGYSAFKEWYWVIQPMLSVITLSLMAGMILQPLDKLRYTRVALWIVAIGAAVSMGQSFWENVQRAMPYGRWAADQPNEEIAVFLEEHTEPGSIIGLTGGGTTAYFIEDRTIVNMDGLINSYTYFRLLQRREAGRYLAEIGMDYVLANDAFIDQLPYDRQFRPYLEETGFRYYNMTLFRYRSGQP